MATISQYNRYSILFVDDEPKARKYFEMSFSDTFRIICTDSVGNALRILAEQAENIALVITDQSMPEEKGLRLIKAVKQQYPEIVRMLTTAYSDLNDAIESVNKGEIFRYILKPWDIEILRTHLLEAMNFYLEKREERQLLSGKKQTMFQVASSIAHELRTPLAGIYATVSSIGEDLPELLRGYEAAEQLTGISNISPTRRQAMARAFSNIEHQVRHSQAMISMLLENIRDETARNTQFIESMKHCIIEAVDTYPLFKHQQELIVMDTADDFGFYGNRTAMINVIHNLIKNALYALQASAKENCGIYITLRTSKTVNRMYFKDEGTGIAPDILSYIFDDFFSSKGNSDSKISSGNGIGLAFCKRVLNNWNAEIECHSEIDRFTEFTLTFPEAVNPEQSR